MFRSLDALAGKVLNRGRKVTYRLFIAVGGGSIPCSSGKGEWVTENKFYYKDGRSLLLVRGSLVERLAKLTSPLPE